MEKLPERSSTAVTLLSKQNKVNVVAVKISRESKYILTVGFETNYPDAFYNNTLNLSVDFGHVFFYVTRREALSSFDIVDTFFSFGPAGYGENGKIINEYNSKRPGDTAFLIKEVSQMFRLRISKEQGEKIKAKTSQFTYAVDTQQIFYNASTNDTCAETARDILSSCGVPTPDGHSAVIGTGNLLADIITYNLAMVNPYMWFKNFCALYGSPIFYYGDSSPVKAQNGERGNEDGYKIDISKFWLLVPNQFDPLPELDKQKIHGDVR